MVCPNCHVGYMLQHHMTEMSQRKWLNCTTCGYCAKEQELVQYYQEPEETRVIPRKSIAEAENKRHKDRSLGRNQQAEDSDT